MGIEKDCTKLVFQKLDGNITMQQYCDGLILLNSKYPTLGFNHVADTLYQKWIRAKPKPLDLKSKAAGEEEIPF